MSNVKFEKKVFVREKTSPFRKGRCFRNSSYLDEGPSIPSIELRTGLGRRTKHSSRLHPGPEDRAKYRGKRG